MNTYGGSEHGDLARAADQGLSADQCQCLVSYISIYFYSGYRRHGLMQLQDMENLLHVGGHLPIMQEHFVCRRQGIAF